MTSMKRPSRGASRSATTMRVIGSFLGPSRRRRMRVAMFPFLVCAGLPGEPSAEGQLHAHASGLPRDLHELLHLLELRQQLIHFLHGAAGALGDPRSAL